jgi:hypothetical protein
MLKMGISKLRAKEDHVLQLRKLDVDQMEGQHQIGLLQIHLNRKLGEPQMERQLPIERQAAHQNLIGQHLPVHLIGQHHPVHLIGQHHPVHLIDPQGQDQCRLILVQVVHLVVVQEAEVEVEDDRKIY